MKYKFFLFFLFTFLPCFSQYIVIKKPLIHLLEVYLPRAFVENPYYVKIFVLNNGTDVLEIYEVNASDGAHTWQADPQNPTRIPPGYIGILFVNTRVYCSDFGKDFSVFVRINSSGGEIAKTSGKFVPEVPIQVIYPLAISSEAGKSKRKIIQFVNYGYETKDFPYSLKYPINKMFVRFLISDTSFPVGSKYAYIEVVPYISGYLGEINLSFPVTCEYLVTPNPIYIKVKGIYKGSKLREVILTPEISDPYSTFILFVISLILLFCRDLFTNP